MNEVAAAQEVPPQTRDSVVVLLLENRRVPGVDGPIEDQLIRLMNEHERAVYSFLMALLRDEDCALDCAQDTFLRAYEQLRAGKPVNTAWLYKVARNRAMDEFRRRRRFQRDEEKLAQMPVHEPTEQVMVVQSVLDRLPPSDRELLYLFDIAGFRTDEIGAMLGIRGSAVRQRLSRARQRFRALYGGQP